MCDILFEFGFVQSVNDFSLFAKSKKHMHCYLISLSWYAILIGNSLDAISRVKKFLKIKFMIKDLGKIKYFLGIDVVYIQNGICLFQRK